MTQRRSPASGSRHPPVERQIIAGLADRPDDVGDDLRRAGPRRPDRLHLVMGVIERRTDEIVHRRVDDDEGFGLAALDVEHPRHQNAGVADDQPARLENEARTPSSPSRALTIFA